MTGARVCLLAGGFGGARFAPGLEAAVGAGRLEVVANPGDDLSYDGGEVWPDFDSIVYALAGVFDEAQGWGIAGDAYSAAGWFRIGDRDLSLARRRAEWLRSGLSRGDAARRFAKELGVETPVWPASGGRYRTYITTASGRHEFQEYLVRLRAGEPPLGIERDGPAQGACPEAVLAIAEADLVILGPSNPITSLLPIVEIPEIRRALEGAARVVGISPVVRAVAPALPPEQGRYRVRELFLDAIGVEHSASAIRGLWEGATGGFVVDHRDGDEIGESDTTLGADLLAASIEERAVLARRVVAFGLELPEAGSRRDLGPFLSRAARLTAAAR